MFGCEKRERGEKYSRFDVLVTIEEIEKKIKRKTRFLFFKRHKYP
jgi:hypothetical protein